MSIHEGELTRRTFFRDLGVGVAGLSGIWGSRISVDLLQPGSCAPPPHGAATPFYRDCRPIRPRQIADRLTPAEVTELKDAYQAMRALDISDPTDPRGFTQQAHVHCYYCATSDPTLQMHGSWRFFAWHRAYLYFHERILGKLVGNQNFRLPFWGWDVASYQKLPSPYVTPNDSTNPLHNSTRVLAPGVALPNEDVGATVISDVLSLGSFPDFGGSATGSGIPEGTPHGAVHVDVGGDMGFFSSAAQDPIFYQHHATVDKLWSDWSKASSAHTNPTDPAFRNLTFTFCDENRVWRSIKASQVLDHENSLRYVYEPYRFWDVFRCFIWRPIAINWTVAQKISIASNPTLARALTSDAPIRLHLARLQVPRDRSTVYRVYTSQAEAAADAGPGSPGYLGSVSVVLNDPENKHPVRGTRNVILNLLPGPRAALGRGEEARPFLVDRNDRSPSKRVVPVRAANAFFSRGDLEREP